MSAPPTTQRAWVVRSTGDPLSVLKLESSYPVPIPKPGELLIRVKASSLNPVHYKFISNPVMGLMLHKPAIPESDFAGFVAGGDLTGTGFELGTEVFGITSADRVSKSGQGTMGQYTTALVKNVVEKPENLSMEEAASFSLAGLTAWEGLVKRGGLKDGGMRVFINGGSGGVGAWAIQIAKHFNATVITTSSPRSLDFIQQLSPTVALDYTQVDLPSHLSSTYASDPFDIVFDTVGTPELFYASHNFLKKKTGKYLDIGGGKYDTVLQMLGLGASVVGRIVAGKMGWRPSYTFYLVNSESMGGELKECASLLEHGVLKAHVDSVYPFENALEAYKKQMSGRAQGKIVVTID